MSNWSNKLDSIKLILEYIFYGKISNIGLPMLFAGQGTSNNKARVEVMSTWFIYYTFN